MEPIVITTVCIREVREQCVPSSSLPHGSEVACGVVIAVSFEGHACLGGCVFPEHPLWGAAGMRMPGGAAGRGSSWPLQNVWRKRNTLKGIRSL